MGFEIQAQFVRLEEEEGGWVWGLGWAGGCGVVGNECLGALVHVGLLRFAASLIFLFLLVDLYVLPSSESS